MVIFFFGIHLSILLPQQLSGLISWVFTVNCQWFSTDGNFNDAMATEIMRSRSFCFNFIFFLHTGDYIILGAIQLSKLNVINCMWLHTSKLELMTPLSGKETQTELQSWGLCRTVMFWGLGADPDILALWVCQARFNVCEAELEDTPGNMGSRGLLCEAQRRRGKFQRPRWREGKRQKEKAAAVRCQLCCKAKAKQFSNVRGVFNLSIMPKMSHTITENYGVQPYRIPKTSVWCIFILQQKLFCSYMHKMVFPHFLSIRICCRHSSESSQSSSRNHLQWRPAFRWETP